MTMPPLTPEQRMQLDRESRQAAREAIRRALVYEQHPPVELVSDGVDPVKAAALHEAVALTAAATRAGHLTMDEDRPRIAVGVARVFETYLRETDARQVTE